MEGAEPAALLLKFTIDLGIGDGDPCLGGQGDHRILVGGAESLTTFFLSQVKVAEDLTLSPHWGT
jgi:hypothetical protein